MDRLDEQIIGYFNREEKYAKDNSLVNTQKALAYVKAHLFEAQTGNEMQREYLIHGLSMVWIIIELHLPVTAEEQDLMLASSLLHVIPELKLPLTSSDVSVDESVISYVNEITKIDSLELDEVEPYYREIGKDRLLLMVKMVERSNVIEHLCDMSAHEAKAFMWETKRHLFLMCLDGKENFPEFDTAFGSMLEKMRCLIQVMDILYKKYDAEEEELYDEIWSLHEENTRIKRALQERNIEK